MTDIFCSNVHKTLNEGAVAPRVRTVVMAIGILLWYALLPVPLHAAGEEPGARQQLSKEQNGTGDKGDVVARVNGVEITQQELKAKMMRMLEARRSGNAGGDVDPEVLRKDALDKLILRELAYQRAKAEGIRVGSDELDNAVAEIKANVGEDKYREALGKRGMTEEDLRKDLEKNLMVKHIFEKEVSGLVTVSEEEVEKEYESIKDEFSEPEKVVVADFVMFLDMDDKSAPEKAEELIRRIKDAGEDVLNIPSDGKFLVRQLEINKNKQPELYAEAKKLSEGEVSGLIRTPDSLHILKLLKYSPEVKAQFSQIRGFVERRVRARAQQKKTAEWEAELKKNARIEIVGASEDGK